ncbi:MAG: tRNA (adenosine(37)-N6)-threonylcarbamoyltransferase complex dimerization subunit type 1 TsaB [Dehalococcoidia bacterium]|nr:tRNA (adenosine(37)-N6)-threonylcarbamoyltransferase complex dimerization subunit type 1 TsaB [Dehalococcoidia bacterium]
MSDQPPLMLAIDTSTRMAGVAIARGDVVVAEYTWLAGQHHTEQLLPAVDTVLKGNGFLLSDVQAVAVATGPGSFNGLRVGLATVKSLAVALGLPIVSATSLEVEAYAHAVAPWPICAIHDAGRKEVAWAIYRGPAAEWRCTVQPQITSPEALAARLRGRTLLCGEIPEGCLVLLQGALGPRAIIPSLAARVRRPGLLAELGYRRLQAGLLDDVNALQPLYLRRPPPVPQPRSQEPSLLEA